jgi:hypothetical protein
LPDELLIDVELCTTRGTLSAGDIWLTGNLELETNFLTPRRDLVL